MVSTLWCYLFLKKKLIFDGSFPVLATVDGEEDNFPEN